MYSASMDLNVGSFLPFSSSVLMMRSIGAGHPGEDDIGGLVLVGISMPGKKGVDVE
jgi:hypothetical protein